MASLFFVSALNSLAAFALYYFLWISPWRSGLARFKIRQDPVKPRQLRWEALWTFLYPFSAALCILGVNAVFGRLGLSKVYFQADEHSVAYFWISSIAFVLLADFFRYACHWLMHRWRFLYRHVHSWHHESLNVNPLSTLSMHPADLLSGVPWLFATNLFPVHITAIITFANFYHFQNMYRHLGYDFLGERNILSRIFVSPRNHDLHHTQIRCNFGACFAFWDKIFGTYLKPEECQGKSDAVPVH